MNLFQRMAELGGKGESFVLAAIIARSGSAPRAAGTRMIVRADGSIAGTIGGGVLEAMVQESAKEVFRHRRMITREFVLSADDASRMGMICGGRVQVLIHHVDASDPLPLQLFRAVASALEENERAWLVTALPVGDDSEMPPAYGLLLENGAVTGALDADLLKDIVEQAGAGGGEPRAVSLGTSRYLVEPLCHEGTVYIFGAGHISQKLAPLTKLVGFRTVVLDDREEFANRERFPEADRIVVLDNFDAAFGKLDIGEDGFIVLVTRGHAHDKTLLGQALGTPAQYIGMIGSRRKRDAVYQALANEGFAPEDFERVHSPIGLDIGAETPEEIAVCIVAELIRERAKKNR